MEQLQEHESKFKNIKKDKVETVDKAHNSISAYISTLLNKNMKRIDG